MLLRPGLVGLIKSFSSLAKINSAFGFEEDAELLGPGEINEGGLRFSPLVATPGLPSSLWECMEAKVGDVDVRGVCSDISILVVEDTDSRLVSGKAFGGWSEGAADRGTVEKRVSSSISTDSSSSSDGPVTDAVVVGGSSAAGDSRAATEDRESLLTGVVSVFRDSVFRGKVLEDWAGACGFGSVMILVVDIQYQSNA